MVPGTYLLTKGLFPTGGRHPQLPMHIHRHYQYMTVIELGLHGESIDYKVVSQSGIIARS